MDSVEITRKNYLSAANLTALRHVERAPSQQGVQRAMPNGTVDEVEELEALHDELRRQLSVPNVASLTGRALAVWDAAEQAVQVVKKDGKFGYFGYHQDGKTFLEYFEAMFLLELSRLQLEFNLMVVSIEQAYLLLFGEAPSVKFNQYLVYSAFSKAGYIVIKPQCEHYKEYLKSVTPQDCIWRLLQSTLHNTPTPDYIVNAPYFAKVKENMEQTKSSIMLQQTVHQELPLDTANETTIDFNRKITSSMKKIPPDSSSGAHKANTKRTCLVPFGAVHETTETNSYLDMLKVEPEYEQFCHMFAKFDVIRLTPKYTSEETCDELTCRDLDVNFELHMHNEGFRKSRYQLPSFYLTVLEPDAPYPNHAEVSKLQRQYEIPVPLLIVSVNESKQMQASLYHCA